MAMTVSSNTLAQNLSGAYFMDGYAFGHQLNPAKEYDRKGYVAFPLVPLGNMNVALRGNLNLKDVLYPNPNGSGLVTPYPPSLLSHPIFHTSPHEPAPISVAHPGNWIHLPSQDK